MRLKPTLYCEKTCNCFRNNSKATSASNQLSNGCGGVCFAITDTHPPSQLNAAFDHAKRTDDAVARYVNGSVYTCCRMDHGNFSLFVLVLAQRRLDGKGIYRGRGEEMKIKTKNNDTRFEGVHR